MTISRKNAQLAQVVNVSGNAVGDTIFIPSSGIVNISGALNLNNIPVSISGHLHSSSDIVDFNSSVSGLLPVKNIVSGTGIIINSVSGIYTIISTGSGVLSDQAKSLVTTVFNNTGSSIPKMTAVYINGGQGDMPTIQKAIATGDLTSAGTYGLTYQNIDNMSTGQVIVFGVLTGLNTDQFNPTAPVGNINGTVLYLSPTTSGALTTTKPSAPNHIVAIGTVVRTHQNEGVIEVRVQNGFELEELHNVAISGVTNGQFLQYNSASGLWLASSSGNFTTLQVNGTGVSVSGHIHTSSDITNFNTAVSGLLPTITNSGDNRILTSTGSSVGINAESNLTFNGSLLNVNGSGYFSSGIFLGSQSTIGNIGGQYIGFEDGLIFLRRNDDSISISLEEDLLTANNGNSLSWGDRILYGSNGNPILYWADKIGIYNAIPQYTLDVTGSGNFSDGLFVNGTGVSISGHAHTSSDITDFNSSVSGLLPVTDISGGQNITVSKSGTIYTVAVTGSLGLTTEEVDDRISNLLVAGTGISLSYDDTNNSLTINTSGNYSVVGHSHTSSNITNFDSSVSGLFSKTYSVFSAIDNQPPASGFATLDTRNSIAVLDFDDTTKETAVFVGVMPQSVALASGLSIRTHWMATTATSGDCRWEVSLERSNTDLDSDSFDTVSTGSSTTNGTAGIPTATSITLTTIDGVTAGDLYRLRVSRDATNGADTMAGDAELIAVEVRSAS